MNGWIKKNLKWVGWCIAIGWMVLASSWFVIPQIWCGNVDLYRVVLIIFCIVWMMLMGIGVIIDDEGYFSDWKM